MHWLLRARRDCHLGPIAWGFQHFLRSFFVSGIAYDVWGCCGLNSSRLRGCLTCAHRDYDSEDATRLPSCKRTRLCAAVTSPRADFRARKNDPVMRPPDGPGRIESEISKLTVRRP